MNILNGSELFLALPALCVSGYLCVYLALRVSGLLRVNAEGWHAGSVYMGMRVVIPAVGLFALFHPLMRLESAAFRRVARLRDGGEREPAVSDVVVEFIPIM